MDTRFWGPDGWQLLHSVAVTYPERPSDRTKQVYKEFFETLRLMLPCIYCRNSFFQFVDELPIDPYLKDRKTLNYWVYLMHNKVNDKLFNQGLHVEYGDDFIAMHRRYLDLVQSINKEPCKDTIPGWDFIYSILFNYPKKRSFSNEESDRYKAYVDFFYLLAEVMPFKTFKAALKDHLKKYPIENNLSLPQLKRWGYVLEQNYCNRVKLNCPNFKDRCHSIEIFRAGCNGKNDPKPTCHIKEGVLKQLKKEF